MSKLQKELGAQVFSLFPCGDRLSYSLFGKRNKIQNFSHLQGCLGRSMIVIWPGSLSLDRVSLWPRLLPSECKDQRHTSPPCLCLPFPASAHSLARPFGLDKRASWWDSGLWGSPPLGILSNQIPRAQLVYLRGPRNEMLRS